MPHIEPLLDDDDPKNGREPGSTRLQEFFLPVHGYVRLHRAEVAIVNHPAFQRLRKCRQLGFAHLVFPGAVHTRFEHSIGATYVAEKIVQYVNFNAAAPEDSKQDKYAICGITEEVRRIIRLGALLHDIGHIPLGHTLEDELEHLEKHDGEARVDRLAGRVHPEYGIDPALQFSPKTPTGGWSLAALIDALYEPTIAQIFQGGDGRRLSAFDVLKLVTLKRPTEAHARKAWDDREDTLAQVFPVSVCRDIIGNTICADFLDYLFRDWYHVGKPMTEDRRLYQYMEVRVPTVAANKLSSQEFVINIGPDQKLRHDALTSIFELLEGRYKLAETVLFHRTKLAMTALLDRCFLELRHLYESTGLRGTAERPDEYLSEQALGLLLEASDDDIPSIIRRLAKGVTPSDSEVLKSIQLQRDEYVSAALKRDARQPTLGLVESADATGRPLAPFDVGAQQQLIELLATRLERRTMYTLAYKFPLRSLDRRDYEKGTPEAIPAKLRSLVQPATRRKQITMVEHLFGLPPGSVTLYAPPTAKMNAKIAKVKLLIDGRIKPFDQYETDMGDASQTGGLLAAQVRRFYELWGVSVYIDRPNWHLFPQDVRDDIARALRDTIYLPHPDADRPLQRRKEIESTIQSARKVAARGQEPQSAMAQGEYSTEEFASGLPFALPDSRQIQ